MLVGSVFHYPDFGNFGVCGISHNVRDLDEFCTLYRADYLLVQFGEFLHGGYWKDVLNRSSICIIFLSSANIQYRLLPPHFTCLHTTCIIKIQIQHDRTVAWEGSGMDWIVLGFAVVTPLTVTITLAFQRRERALFEISRVRSFCFQIYLGHAIWDWNSGNGRNAEMTRDEWIEHTDLVLEHLVGIGDELSRFLTLPTSSRSYHRMLKSGRSKAANIVEVAYRLLDSFYTQRIVQISLLTENLKAKGLATSEISRLRQYERFIGEAVENLRMIKMYRTPQALRSFGRIFTLILPAFYAPAFAQLALDLNSFSMGILFAIITPLVLTALFQTMQVMEDPFVGWVTLDGIDVTEEMEVLHFHQLISARATLFPGAPPFEGKSKAAIVTEGAVSIIDGVPSSIGGSCRASRFSKLATGLGGADGDGDGDNGTDAMQGTNRVSHFLLDGSSTKTSAVASISGSHRRLASAF